MNPASALEDAGYAVEAVEPPSLDVAAKTALDMLAPDWRLISPMLSPLLGPKTKTVWGALLEMGGDQDRAAAMEAYVTRQSPLRAWGEFQESHLLIVAPVATDLPFEADKGRNSAEMVEIVHGLGSPHDENPGVFTVVPSPAAPIDKVLLRVSYSRSPAASTASSRRSTRRSEQPCRRAS